MGLPWYVAATVISIAHIDSLKMETETSAPGEQPKFLGVRWVPPGRLGFIHGGDAVCTCLLKGNPHTRLYPGEWAAASYVWLRWNHGPPLEPLDQWRKWSDSADEARKQSRTVRLIGLEWMFCIGPIFSNNDTIEPVPQFLCGNLSWCCWPRFSPFRRVKQATPSYENIAHHDGSPVTRLSACWLRVMSLLGVRARYVVIHIIRIALCHKSPHLCLLTDICETIQQPCCSVFTSLSFNDKRNMYDTRKTSASFEKKIKKCRMMEKRLHLIMQLWAEPTSSCEPRWIWSVDVQTLTDPWTPHVPSGSLCSGLLLFANELN